MRCSSFHTESPRFIRLQMWVSSTGKLTLKPLTSSRKVWEIIFQEVKEWGCENNNKKYSFQKNLHKKKLNLCCPVEDDSVAQETKPLHSCTGWVHMVQAPPFITYRSVLQMYKWWRGMCEHVGIEEPGRAINSQPHMHFFPVTKINKIIL